MARVELLGWLKVKNENIKDYIYDASVSQWSGNFIVKMIRDNRLKVTNAHGNEIQRDYEEWSEDDEREYLDSVLKNDFPHPDFYAIRHGAEYYVVDGQHRMMTIHKYVTQGKLSNQETSDLVGKNFNCKTITLGKETENFRISLGFHIFETLNVKRSEVDNGAAYKGFLKSIDRDSVEELFALYTNSFKVKKRSEPVSITKIQGLQNNENAKYYQDDVYDMLGLMFVLTHMGLKEFYKIKTLRKEIIEQLDFPNEKKGKSYAE